MHSPACLRTPGLPTHCGNSIDAVTRVASGMAAFSPGFCLHRLGCRPRRRRKRCCPGCIHSGTEIAPPCRSHVFPSLGGSCPSAADPRRLTVEVAPTICDPKKSSPPAFEPGSATGVRIPPSQGGFFRTLAAAAVAFVPVGAPASRQTAMLADVWSVLVRSLQ